MLSEAIQRRISPEPMSGCWLWVGGESWNGYGKLQHNNKLWMAHRLVYTQLIGQIPEQLQLDHKCRIRCCVNPEHLEPVTAKVNQHRGMSPAGINARKTHCKNGHEFTSENTYNEPSICGSRRVCRICKKVATATYGKTRKSRRKVT